MHGYELRKRLNLMLGWGRVLSYGSLYPALKKMLRADLIEELDGHHARRRGGPGSSTRSPTPGTSEFERLMSEVGPTAWEDDNFDIRFAFFGRTDMEIRLRVLEGRRTRLQERLARVQPTSSAPRPRSTATPPSSSGTGSSRSSARCAGSPTSSAPNAASQPGQIAAAAAPSPSTDQ